MVRSTAQAGSRRASASIATLALGQRPQLVELGTQDLGPEPGAAIRKLGEPLGAPPHLIDLGAVGGDGASAEQRLEPEHHAGRVFHERAVGPGQLLQRRAMGAAVMDGAQPAPPEQLREGVGIDLIALVALARRPAPVTDDHAIDEGCQEIVQPTAPGCPPRT